MKIKGSYVFALMVTIALLILLADDSFAQCSMCRKIATDGTNEKTVDAASLNSGILYLLALPYFLIAFFFRKQIYGFVSTLRVKK